MNYEPRHEDVWDGGRYRRILNFNSSRRMVSFQEPFSPTLWEKSRLQKRGLARLHRLSGCEEEIIEIYHRLCCRPFRSIVIILSYAGSVCPHCNSNLNCPQIAVYRAAWSSCFETPFFFFSQIMRIFRTPKLSSNINKAYVNNPHNAQQSTDYWAQPEITHNLRYKLR